jgi:hypothetical protein
MLNREARTMMTEMELLELAEKEAGRLLTETEKWFVWTHPSMMFLEIREMLDTEEKMRQDGKNLPNWPQFG